MDEIAAPSDLGDRYLNLNDVAAMLQMPVWLADMWVANMRDFPPAHEGEHGPRWLASEVDAYARSCAEQPLDGKIGVGEGGIDCDEAIAHLKQVWDAHRPRFWLDLSLDCVPAAPGSAQIRIRLEAPTDDGRRDGPDDRGRRPRRRPRPEGRAARVAPPRRRPVHRRTRRRRPATARSIGGRRCL